MNRRLLVMSLVLFGAVGLAAPSTAQENRYGINVHRLNDAIWGDRVVELGARMVRIDFDWNSIEPVRGQRNFSGQRQSVNNALNRGLYVFVTLAYTPSWANGGRSFNVPPTNMQDWRNFVLAAIQAFPEVTYWGIWNEPNDPQYLSNSAAYRTLAENARDVIKTWNPALKVIGPEVSTGGVTSGWYRTTMQQWGGTVFDIVTIHYYNFGNSETKWVDQFMDTYVKPYRAGKPVWMTETGRDCKLGLTAQANHYMGVLDRWRGRESWWTKTFFYHLYDGKTCSAGSEGILDPAPGYGRRPAFFTYHDWIAAHP